MGRSWFFVSLGVDPKKNAVGKKSHVDGGLGSWSSFPETFCGWGAVMKPYGFTRARLRMCTGARLRPSVPAFPYSSLRK